MSAIDEKQKQERLLLRIKKNRILLNSFSYLNQKPHYTLCSSCKKVLSLDNFYKNPNGYKKSCKSCLRKYVRNRKYQQCRRHCLKTR